MHKLQTHRPGRLRLRSKFCRQTLAFPGRQNQRAPGGGIPAADGLRGACIAGRWRHECRHPQGVAPRRAHPPQDDRQLPTGHAFRWPETIRGRGSGHRKTTFALLCANVVRLTHECHPKAVQRLLRHASAFVFSHGPPPPGGPTSQSLDFVLWKNPSRVPPPGGPVIRLGSNAPNRSQPQPVIPAAPWPRPPNGCR